MRKCGNCSLASHCAVTSACANAGVRNSAKMDKAVYVCTVWTCAVFTVLNVGMSIVRKTVLSSTDATVERLLTRCSMLGSYRTRVAKSVGVH